MLRRIQFLPADVLGLSSLAAAARAGAAGAPLRLPRRWEEVRRPPDGFDREAREQLARALEARLTELAPHVQSLESVRSLATPGASCVVCTIRPAFLGPRLGDLWGALACVRSAAELARRFETPVVPLAWIRSDGEAEPELARAWIPNRRHELQRVALPSRASEPTAADAPLDDERERLPAIRAFLRQLYGDAQHVDDAIALLVPRHGESLARATVRALLALFGQRGLVVVEPAWLGEEPARALAGVVADDPLPALARRSAQHAELAGVREQRACVLHAEAAHRRALRIGGEGYRYDGEVGSRTPAELAAQIVQDPRCWSAGELFAPLVLRRLLPIAAFLIDEQELPIHALLSGLATRAGEPENPPLLRAAATLVDEETERALARLERDVAVALSPHADADDAAPAPAITVVDELRAISESALRELGLRRAALAELEPSLGGQLGRALAQARGAIERVCAKAERVAADQSGRGRRHERRLQSLLRPLDRPQEQVLGAFTFWAVHGTQWVDELIEDWDPLAPEHVVAHLGTDR